MRGSGQDQERRKGSGLPRDTVTKVAGWYEREEHPTAMTKRTMAKESTQVAFLGSVKEICEHYSNI